MVNETMASIRQAIKKNNPKEIKKILLGLEKTTLLEILKAGDEEHILFDAIENRRSECFKVLFEELGRQAFQNECMQEFLGFVERKKNGNNILEAISEEAQKDIPFLLWRRSGGAMLKKVLLSVEKANQYIGNESILEFQEKLRDLSMKKEKSDVEDAEGVEQKQSLWERMIGSKKKRSSKITGEVFRKKPAHPFLNREIKSEIAKHAAEKKNSHNLKPWLKVVSNEILYAAADNNNEIAASKALSYSKADELLRMKDEYPLQVSPLMHSIIRNNLRVTLAIIKNKDVLKKLVNERGENGSGVLEALVSSPDDEEKTTDQLDSALALLIRKMLDAEKGLLANELDNKNPVIIAASKKRPQSTLTLLEKYCKENEANSKKMIAWVLEEYPELTVQPGMARILKKYKITEEDSKKLRGKHKHSDMENSLSESTRNIYESEQNKVNQDPRLLLGSGIARNTASLSSNSSNVDLRSSAMNMLDTENTGSVAPVVMPPLERSKLDDSEDSTHSEKEDVEKDIEEKEEKGVEKESGKQNEKKEAVKDQKKEKSTSKNSPNTQIKDSKSDRAMIEAKRLSSTFTAR